jgi:AraC-like DNA-binding protein
LGHSNGFVRLLYREDSSSKTKQIALELLYDPVDSEDGGIPMPVPARLRRFLSSWASPKYREYPFGYTLIQEYHSKRFSIHIWRIHAETPAKLYPSSDRPMIALQFMLEGDLPCVLVGYGPKRLQHSKYELFYVPISHNEAWFEPGEYESLHIEMEPEFLDDIADTYPQVRQLLDRLGQASEKGVPLIPVIINYVVRAILKNLRKCEKTGGDLKIVMHRYIVDLLTEYIAGIKDQEEDERRINIPHKETLIRIKQEILAYPHIHNQSIYKLQMRHAINAMTLKKNFKSLFDSSIGAFVRFHALTHAHYLIVTTQRSIDDISDEVGYHYRSNFDKSFKRQFDYSPSSLRDGANGAGELI